MFILLKRASIEVIDLDVKMVQYNLTSGIKHVFLDLFVHGG